MTAADGPQIDIEPLTPSRLGLRPAEWLRRIRAAVLAYPRLAAGMLLAVTVLSFADLVAGRYRIPAAVVYLDLDKFKAVNDSLGHQAGDRLLIGIAEILKQNIRATDVAARLGGDEFALILTYTSLDEAKTVAERLAQAFREHHVSIGDQLVATTGSFGVVGIDRKSSVSALMVAADLAMYAVKNRGGNGVSLVPLIA